jgi:hypothetical protein
MRTKGMVPRWRQALRRAWDMAYLVLLAVVYVFRDRASRQRWQSGQVSHRGS